MTASAVALPLCLIDRDGRTVEANAAFAALAGMTPASILGCPLAALGLIDPNELQQALAALDLDAAPPSGPVKGAGPCAGREALISAAENAEGVPAGLAILFLPSGATQLAEQERRASFAMESAGQWIWEFDLVADTVWRSNGWQRALGYADGELPDDDEPWSIVHPDDRSIARNAVERLVGGGADIFEATYRLGHRDGSWRWFMSRGRIVARAADGRPQRLLATTIDVHRQKETEAQLTAAMAEGAEISRRLAELNSQLAELSDRDGLTGLANRRVFEREWPIQVETALHRGQDLALLMIDVDHFKQFNDRMGHIAGDQCLRRVASHLARSADPGDLVCRYGGEEFAVLLAGAGSATAGAYADRVMAAIERLAEPHPDSPFGRLTVSIGLAALEPGETAEGLLKRADDALYDAKRGGRNRISLAPSGTGLAATG